MIAELKEEDASVNDNLFTSLRTSFFLFFLMKQLVPLALDPIRKVRISDSGIESGKAFWSWPEIEEMGEWSNGEQTFLSVTLPWSQSFFFRERLLHGPKSSPTGIGET